MRDEGRLQELATKHGAVPVSRCQPLVGEAEPDFGAAAFRGRVRDMLAKNRTDQDRYKDPSKGLKGLLRSKSKIGEMRDPSKWIFSHNERRDAIDEALRRREPAGVVQALIEFPTRAGFDVNIRWKEEPSKGSKRRSSSNPTEQKSKWLEQATSNNLTDHVRLLASRGARQEALDAALGIALTNNSRQIATELVRYGADTNVHHQFFQRAVESDDVDMATIFLQASPPKDLSLNHLNSALEYAVANSLYTITALLEAHGAEPNWRSGQLLQTLAESQNLRITSLLLLRRPRGIKSGYFLRAVDCARNCTDRQIRIQLLDLLLSAGAPADADVFHDLLCSAIRDDQIDLIELLIQHSVSPDANGGATLILAVEHKRVTCLNALLKGTVSPSTATAAIDHIPQTLSQEEALFIAEALFAKGARDGEWGMLLAHAVQKSYNNLIGALIDHGASIDYDNAFSLRIALKRADFPLLQLLLRGRSSPQFLAKAIPEALQMVSQADRRNAIIALLNKKVAGDELHFALQRICANHSLRDVEVVTALLMHGASVNLKDKNGNCICSAVKQGDFEILSILCDYGPSDQILSFAFATAYASRSQIPRSDILNIMDLLLNKAAQGSAVAETLINVVRVEDERDILLLLLKHGADVNYKSGLPIEEALQAPSTTSLQDICGRARIESQTFDRLIPMALERQDYKIRAAMLIGACRKYRSVLSRALIREVTQLNGREDAVRMLLEAGATVNFKNGEALCQVVRDGNIGLARVIAVNPDNSSLSAAFRAASALEPPETRRAMMEFLLAQTSTRTEIGQTDGLVAECRRGASTNVAIIRLLLQHNANVDFQNGAALQHAVSGRSAELLMILLMKRPDQCSLSTAFTAARQLTCSTHKRLELFQLLLGAGYRGDQLNYALVEAITRSPDDLRIPQLLLQNDASVDFDNGVPLSSAVRSGNETLVQILIATHPDPKSLENAFRVLRSSNMSENRRFSICALLLTTDLIPTDEISAALIDAVRAERNDVRLFRLLLNSDASLDHSNGEALCTAVERGDLATSTLFLESQAASSNVLDRAFDCCFKLCQQARLSLAKLLLPKGVSSNALGKYLKTAVIQKDHDLLRLLIHHGADTEFQGGDALVATARNGDPIAFQMLMPSTVRPSIIDRAFEAAIESRTVESFSGGLHVAELLLRQGVGEHLKNEALLDAVQSYKQVQEGFIKLLLNHGADVNIQNGQCFFSAADREDYELFDMLLGHEPSFEIVIHRLMMSIESEEKVVPFLRRCFNHSQNFFESQDNRLLFIAMERFPSGAALVKLLLDSGCSAGATQVLKLKLNYEAEELTPLVWALYQPRPGIKNSVIMALLERGNEGSIHPSSRLRTSGHLLCTVNPHFVTEKTQKTAIFKAAKSGRHTVLRKLIELKVNVNTRNHKRRTPLFYASRQGDMTAVDIIYSAGAYPNDGSIQEAAREGHPDVVAYLLNTGHDPEDPSEFHWGRSALAEMCLLAEPCGVEWEAKAYRIVQMLFQAGASVTEKYDGKTVLHLALDNDSPLQLTRTLLQFPQIWKRLNDDVFLYEDSQNICYSPTKYVERFYVGTADGMRQTLINLLKSKRCKDRLFSTRGEHPPGAQGLPDDLAAIVRRESLADRELEQTKRRMKEMVTLEIELSNQRNENSIRQDRQREAYQIESGQRKHERELARNGEVSQQRRLAIAAEHELELRNKEDAAVQSRRIEDTDRAAYLEHIRSLAVVEQRKIDAKLNAQRQWLQTSDESFRMRAQKMKALADACKGSGISGNSLGLLSDASHTVD